MDFFLNNWQFLVLSIAVIALAAAYIIKFVQLPSKDQLEKVQEWLLWAVAEAEKVFGSKTGQLKLRYVYDLFDTRFEQVAKYVSFEQFSELVDKALEKFNNMLASNKRVEEYITPSPTVVIIEQPTPKEEPEEKE